MQFRGLVTVGNMIMLCSWDRIGHSVKKSIEPIMCPPSYFLCFTLLFQCRMWHVSGVIFVVKCFVFFSCHTPFHAYLLLFPYTSGIFLFMCDYWSCIIGWVCLIMVKVLCSPSALYACTSHVQQPLYCFWYVSSSVTVTETGFLASLGPLWKSTSYDGVKLSQFIRTKSGKIEISSLYLVINLQSVGKTAPLTFPWSLRLEQVHMNYYFLSKPAFGTTLQIVIINHSIQNLYFFQIWWKPGLKFEMWLHHKDGRSNHQLSPTTLAGLTPSPPIFGSYSQSQSTALPPMGLVGCLNLYSWSRSAVDL